MDPIISIVAAVVALGAGVGVGFAVRKQGGAGKNAATQEKVEAALKQAEERKQQAVLEAREQAVKIIEDAKREERRHREAATGIEQRVTQKEQQLERKLEEATRAREQALAREREFEQAKAKLLPEQQTALKKIDEVRAQQLQRLEKISGLSGERARELVLELTEQQMKDRVVGAMKKHEAAIEADKERLARRIISMTIWRMASEVTTEHSTSVIKLPNEELKGRIIGREGRNIKALETLTGVDLLVDEVPNAIVVSGFSAIRRYVAKLAIEQLITDGRIHPGHIEGAVAKAKKAVEKKIHDAGEAALREVGIKKYHAQLPDVAGRLMFRTSYGQNQLKHAVEVATLAGLMAQELGADVEVCKAAGFLHDIGKAIDHDVPGSHVEIGDQLIKKFGFSEAVVRAAETHHETVDFEVAEDWIVAAADAISAARPGARKNTTDEFVKRVTELENIARSFEGVENVYAIDAGREIRVMVQPEKIDDLKAKKLAHAIADRVEADLTYPGEVKVSVIRETRAVDYAR